MLGGGGSLMQSQRLMLRYVLFFFLFCLLAVAAALGTLLHEILYVSCFYIFSGERNRRVFPECSSLETENINEESCDGTEPHSPESSFECIIHGCMECCLPTSSIQDHLSTRVKFKWRHESRTCPNSQWNLSNQWFFRMPHLPHGQRRPDRYWSKSTCFMYYYLFFCSGLSCSFAG